MLTTKNLESNLEEARKEFIMKRIISLSLVIFIILSIIFSIPSISQAKIIGSGPWGWYDTETGFIWTGRRFRGKTIYEALVLLGPNQKIATEYQIIDLVKKLNAQKINIGAEPWDIAGESLPIFDDTIRHVEVLYYNFGTPVWYKESTAFMTDWISENGFFIIETVEECEGDFDNDGDVDGADLAIFAADFGRTNCP